MQKCNCRTVPNVSISYKISSWLAIVDGHVINSLNNNNNNKVATVDDNDYETISSSLFAISVLRLFAI